MENKMIINKKVITKNKAIKANLKESRKIYHHKKKDIGKFYFCDNLEEVKFAYKKNDNDLIKLLCEYDLRGCSGNDFPVYKKLEAMLNFDGKKVLIVNGIECDPSLIHDNLLAQQYKEEIENGIKIVKEYLHIDEAILALKRKNEENVYNDLYKLVYLPFTYPLGEEHILIKELINVDLPQNTLPITKGILVLNIQTIYQIYLIINGLYNNGRYITISNLNTGEAHASYIEFDTSIMEALKKVLKYNNEDVYAGSGAFNCHKIDINDVFTKDINFVGISSYEKPLDNAKCRGCGKCSRNCPAGIDVRKIVKAKEKDINADISMYNPDKCLHCNLCVYNCGAKLNIKHLFK